MNPKELLLQMGWNWEGQMGRQTWKGPLKVLLMA